MEADLTIEHIRPRTEQELLRDAIFELEASDHTDSTSTPTFFQALHIEPVTPLGGNGKSITQAYSTYSSAAEYTPTSQAKKREYSRRERLKETDCPCYKQFLNESPDTEEDGKLLLKALDIMTPTGQFCRSRADKEGGIESLREAVHVYLFPKEGESPENEKNILYLLKKNIRKGNSNEKSCMDAVLSLVFENIRNNFTNELVQERGCHLLTKLSRDSVEVQTAIVHRGGVQLVINAMATHTKTPGVQSRAIGALLCLTMNTAARTQIVERRGAEMISWSMREFPGQLLLQKNGATCLCNLAFNSEENKRRIGRIGGIHAVVSAMNNFIGDADLQARCCLALRNLTCGLRANQWMAGRCQAMEAVLQSMRLMKSDMNIQYHGCVALANLCAEEAENRDRAANLRVFKVATELLRKHMLNSSLCEHALTVLRNICTHSDQNQMNVGEDGGIDLILSCMKVHRFSKRVAERGCCVLRYLFFIRANRLRFAECNGVDALVRIMRDGAEHSDVSETVLHAIGNAVYDNLDSKRAVGRLGGIAALVQIMSNHLDSATIQEQACRALRNLADADDLNLRLITECGAIDAVLLAMMGYLDNGNIQEQGCAMLINVTVLEEGLRQMRDLEAQLVVTRSKKMHLDKVMVQCQAAALLTRLKKVSSASVMLSAVPKKTISRIDTMRKVASKAALVKRPKSHVRKRASDDVPYNGKLVRLVGSYDST
ncbi:unnamed protein product [Agarophyton chilense]